MQLGHLELAGTILLIGSTQFILALTIAEALYPSYSISANYISDLGVGPSAPIFNASVFLLGVTIVTSAYLIYLALKPTFFTFLLALAGVGAMGVGVFNENLPPAHLIASVTTFLFGSLAAVTSYRLTRKPLTYIAIVLGLTGLAALILMGFEIDLGLGVGGIERIIAYPILLWAAGFGGHLADQHEGAATPAKK